MACKLTYKDRKFNDIQSLSKFIKLEKIIENVSNNVDAIYEIEDSNVYNAVNTSIGGNVNQVLSQNTTENLIDVYDSSNDFGIEISELYDKENEVVQKFDSCRI